MKRGVVDVSSVIWTGLRAGKDKEQGWEVEFEGKPHWINSSDYGYANAVGHMLSVMKELSLQPHQLILVKEGMNSKMGRQALYANYKSGKGKAPDWYVEFAKARDQFLEAFLALGCQVVSQDKVESDDVIGYLSKALDGEVWVITGDKDLAQCIGGDVHLYRQGLVDQNPFGPFDVKYIPVAIALMGDRADGIPGAKGFAEKSFEKLLTVFGDEGLKALDHLIQTRGLAALAEDVGELKELQKIIDDADNVYTSYHLARLRIDKINTMRQPLQWTVGMVKPRGECVDQALRHYAGVTTLVSAENYDEALAFMKKHLWSSPFFSLDIETSTPPESDEWLEAQSKEDKVVDVFGSELTGLSITFGPNLQYTYYLTHEHVEEEGVTNLTLAQVRDLVDQIPREKVTWVHNNAFELPVLYNEWGQDWKDDPDYHGFLRNVRDTAIASSYVDENESRGLKKLSKRLLGYEQTSYEQVTTKEYLVSEWSGKGRELGRWFVQVQGDNPEEPDQGPEMVKVQHKMNELTAREVLSYGADDAICTAALANHFVTIMEIEDTFSVFEEVETWPAYLTALAFVQGIDFSLEEMRAMEKDDDEAYDKSWAVLREFLIKVGFDGVHPPVFEEITAANVKEAHQIILGAKLETLVRTPSKLAKLINQAADAGEYSDEDAARLLATVVEGTVEDLNALVKQHFKGEPQLDLDSPKQMKRFLYDVIGIPVQIVNDATDNERDKNPDLAEAIYRFKKKRMGKDVTLTERDIALLKTKAKTDDKSIDYALAFDAEFIDPEQRAALKAVQVMKKVMTRRSLFYKNYWGVCHWKDGKIHPSLNQCAAVTRRYSSSGPNVQQWPKKGEAVRFRGCVKPHHKDAVVASIDFSGQELRLAAERSQDKNMIACYIGDNLKDIHSITAAGAMRLKWGNDFVNDLVKKYADAVPHGMTKEEHEYRLFLHIRSIGKADPIGKLADDLRKDSKNVNFAAQFGGQAAKLSETLIMRYADAQLFLDARSRMFPDVDRAAKRSGEFAEQHGYALTIMGARRHLRNSILSDNRRVSSAALRQAWNMEIQGSAGEMTKLAMGRLWKSGALFKYDVRFMAPVHDELVTSVHRDHAVEFLKIKHDCMTAPYSTMTIPIMGSISLGPDFAHQIECGDWYIKENIEEAVNEAFELKEAA